LRVRLFHRPPPDHRTELMIMYGETLPEDSKVPLESSRDEGVLLHKRQRIGDCD
jgi:hypothetical protein